MKMDGDTGKGKKGLISKTWERCKSMRRGRNNTLTLTPNLTRRSKSWPSMDASWAEEEKRCRKRQVAPEGCFSVYVGPQRQRFVIKTEYANHPLFKMLLEEAESEYGYNSQGPLTLPCDVNLFYNVLIEIDEGTTQPTPHGCAFLKRSPSSYHLLTPSPLLALKNHI